MHRDSNTICTWTDRPMCRTAEDIQSTMYKLPNAVTVLCAKRQITVILHFQKLKDCSSINVCQQIKCIQGIANLMCNILENQQFIIKS